MGLTTTPNLILAGALAAFHEKLNTFPEVWRNHVMEVPTTTKEATYVFPGHLPIPRVMEDGRSIQGFRDFKFTQSDNTYELSLLIDREDLEDDQTGTIRQRFLDLAEVFGTYKDQLFGALLAGGPTAEPPINAADDVTWATFYEAGGTIGDSGAMTNFSTGAASTGTEPVASELIRDVGLMKASLLRFKDDQGRVGFNANSASNLRMVVPPEMELAFSEVMGSTLLPGPVAGDGSRTAPKVQGLAGYDVLPYLSSSIIMYANAVGSERKPFIYQNRTPLEVVIDDSAQGMAERNGVLILCRERFVIGYGDPRRSYQWTWT